MIRRYLNWVDARPKAAALLLVLATLPALILTVQFFSDVRAGLTELLPPEAPASKALEVLHERLGGVGHLTVVAKSNDAAMNRRFIAELGERLKAKKPKQMKQLQADVKVETEWAKNRALLLMPAAKFDEAMTAAEDGLKKAKRKANPLLVQLDDEEEAEPDFAALEQRLESELKAQDRFPNGFFEDADGHHVLLTMTLEGSETELEPSASLWAAVKEEVAAIRPKYPAELVVGYQGEVPGLVEEHDAILSDISLSSLLVFVLVGAVIALYFRSVRAVVTVVFALAPGLLFTFAIGKLTVGHLNSNTAFLGAIIAGNGINFPLIYLAYFRRRPASEPRAESIGAAGKAALFGTLAAALAASAAYGALSVSTFRGFSQFGLIGGVGMVTTWLFTFISMPIAIALFDPPRVTGESRTQAWLHRFFVQRRAPALVAVGFVVLSLAAAAVGVARGFESGLYEMNIRALRNTYSVTHGSASWDAPVANVFGVWMNPVGGIVDDPVHREELARALQQHLVDGPEKLAERVQTIATMVPEASEQSARLERIKKLAAAVEKVPREKFPEKARPWLERWLSPANLEPITVAELPPSIRAGFSEIDGRTDRIVLLFPSLKIPYDDARNVMLFDKRLREVKVPPGAVVGGGFVFMAEIIELVQGEAPRIVWVVALLVALVLAPLFRKHPWRIVVVVASVGAVAVLSQAAMLAAGVRINMLSFAAMPITIGVGADYAVNLFGAMDALKLDARQAVARMGGAIFLCSTTTIIGYASLLVAESGALRTFGWAAVLGEVMAVMTVLVVLPVVMVRAAKGAAVADDSTPGVPVR